MEVFVMAIRIPALLTALLFFSLLSLSGCGSDSKTDTALAPTDPAQATMGQPESLDSPANAISEGRTSGPMLPIYFDFDSSQIRADQVSRAVVNADFLKANQTVKIKIEGNCDPRGTNEYNMALGERRAISAQKYLVNLGVAEGQMETISYGEERILLHGEDELSWAQNRRDDFVIVE
jgi:peptidoglycan-associated lipoprotein